MKIKKNFAVVSLLVAVTTFLILPIQYAYKAPYYCPPPPSPGVHSCPAEFVDNNNKSYSPATGSAPFLYAAFKNDPQAITYSGTDWSAIKKNVLISVALLLIVYVTLTWNNQKPRKKIR